MGDFADNVIWQATSSQVVNPFDIDSPATQQPQEQHQQQEAIVFPTFTTPNTLPLPPYPSTDPAPYPSYPPIANQPSPVATTIANDASPTDSSDPARVLAEEDKRRRNTAASARFRVKKKQREQALEQKTQELEKAKHTLEQRVGQLETENEWLRGLVVEKNGAVRGLTAANKTQNSLEAEADSAKKGVGTDLEESLR